jgi:hypothetical protein
LHGLGELDYRKFLTADITVDGPALFSDIDVLGLSGYSRVIDQVSLRCVKSDPFDDFNPRAFLQVRSSIFAISNVLLQFLM